MSEPKTHTTAADAYESALVPGIFGPWAQAVVASAGIAPGMSVLDVACGTGVATRFAARFCLPGGRVIGIDIDSGMVATAATTAARLGFAADFRCGSADDLPVDPASVDVALCLQGLQFFPDRKKAFSELHRVLKPGAMLIATTWKAIEFCKGYWAMVRALEGRGIDAAPARKPFSLSEEKELYEYAAQAGFRDVTVHSEQRLADFPSTAAFVDAIAQGAPSSRHALAKVPSAQWAAFLSEVNVTLAQWDSGSRLRFPMESNILRARR